MKTMTLFFAMCFILSSHQQTDKKFIRNFIEDIISDKKSVTNGDFDKYLLLHNKYQHKDDLNELIEAQFESFRTKIKENHKSFNIYTYKEADKKLIEIDKYKRGFGNLKGVYFVAAKDKIVLPIVMKNNKIVSFAKSLQKSENEDYYPIYLDH